MADWRASERRALESCPPPSRLDESWRFSDVRKVDVSRFAHAVNPVNSKAALLEALPPLLPGVLRIVFINGVLVEIPAELPEGLVILPLSDVGEEAIELFSKPDWGRFGSEHLARLNFASLTDGIAIRTEPEAGIEPLVEIIYAVIGDKAAIFPATAVRTAPGSSLRVAERHISLDGREHLVSGVQSIEAGAGSALDYALVQDMNDHSTVFEMGAAFLAQGASASHVSSHAGGQWIRQELAVSLTGREARAEILSASRMDGTRMLDQRTFQDHRSGGAYSNLLYKNVLDEASRSVFSGMIKVEPGAHETDAYQSNRNMLLDERSESNSLPGLEILADNVRCSHGSASSSIDPEEIFYLRSRGIPPEKGGRMIAEGFLRQALENCPSTDIVDLVMDSLFPKSHLS